MKSVVGVLLFVTGAAAGAVGSYFYCKKKYAQISEEEISSVKAYYKDRYTSKVNEYEKLKRTMELCESENETLKDHIGVINEDLTSSEPDIPVPTTDLNRNPNEKIDYTQFSTPKKDIKAKDADVEAKIKKNFDNVEIISSTEFDQDLEYDKATLTWYEKDSILADEDDDILEPIEDYIGSAAIHSFGEYEEDSVFVRNNRLEICYEVIREYRSYKSITGRDIRNN